MANDAGSKITFHWDRGHPVVHGTGATTEFELTLDEFRAISHQDGLLQIAQAIDGLANAVHALADAVKTSDAED